MSELEVTAASAPDAPVVTDSASSTDVDYSKTSDDDILSDSFGSPTGSPAVEEPAAETPATPDVEAKPVATEQKVGEVEQPQGDEDFEPESIKALYQKPEVKAALAELFKKSPEARKAWFRAAQIGDLFPTYKEAVELRQMFPTADIAKEVSMHAGLLAEMNRVYDTNPGEFARRLASSTPPQHFGKFVEQAIGILPPAVFERTVAAPVVGMAWKNLEDMVNEASDDEAFQAAFQIMQDRLSRRGALPGGGPRRAQAPQPRVSDDPFRNQPQPERNVSAENYTAFSTATDNSYWSALDKAVSDFIGKPQGFTEGAVARMKQEVVNEVATAIKARPELAPRYEQAKRNGDLSESHRDNAVKFLMTYARTYIPGAVRKLQGQWTKDVLGGNAASVKQVLAVPQNKDVGAGSGKAPQAKPKGLPRRANGQFDYKNMSDEDILNADAI